MLKKIYITFQILLPEIILSIDMKLEKGRGKIIQFNKFDPVFKIHCSILFFVNKQ